MGLTKSFFWCIGLTLLAGATAFSLGCDSKPDSATKPAGETIKVGEFSSMTGESSTWGQQTNKGIRLAIDERNAKGGVKGKQVELTTLDTLSKIEATGQAVQRLIAQDKVVALLGEVASSRSIVASKIAQASGVPMISPASTNDKVTLEGDMIFRACFTDSFQGPVNAQFLYDNLKARKVAIMYDQTQAYSTGLKDEFSKAFTELGGQIVTIQSYKSGDSEYTAQLTTIRDTKPDAVFLPAYYAELGPISRKAKELGINVPFTGGDGWDSPETLKFADTLEGWYYSNHYSEEDARPEVKDFIARYKAKFNEEPGAMAVLGYDAANMLLEALDRAPNTSGKALAAEIAKTKDFKGVSGTITLDKNRNASKPAVILGMKKGAWKFVTNVQPKQKNPVASNQ
jgi:branched-chain amino acid transport system substrate-binding protein